MFLRATFRKRVKGRASHDVPKRGLLGNRWQSHLKRPINPLEGRMKGEGQRPGQTISQCSVGETGMLFPTHITQAVRAPALIEGHSLCGGSR